MTKIAPPSTEAPGFWPNTPWEVVLWDPFVALRLVDRVALARYGGRSGSPYACRSILTIPFSGASIRLALGSSPCGRRPSGTYPLWLLLVLLLRIGGIPYDIVPCSCGYKVVAVVAVLVVLSGMVSLGGDGGRAAAGLRDLPPRHPPRPLRRPLPLLLAALA